MFCRFFILRPVLSIVISIIIVIAGSVAIWTAPISQYPDITPPSIKITATFPGANSETLASAVAAPLEDQISGVSNMIYMQSSSANASNSVTITVYFDIGTDLTGVLSDLLNRVNTAMPQMPLPVQQQGVIVRKASPDLFLLINLYTDGYPDKIFLSNYAYRYIYPVLSQVSGVGLVNLVGNNNFAMRVWLDPKKLVYYGLSANDVILAIQDQNRPFSIGLMAMPPTNKKSQFQFMINTQGYLTDVKQFENIIVKANQNNNQNQIIKVKDLGRVSLDGQLYSTTALKIDKQADGKFVTRDSVALLLYLAPGANQLATKVAIDEAMKGIAKHFPAGIKYYYHYDASVFVKASINQVLETFRDAFILVFLVVFLFIQNLRGTIIPVLAIPVSIIGTFAGIYALGFSINTLTLFGVVLAIGIVVDDAIVVLENVERLMEEEHLSSTDAAIKAMEEVASPVIAIVLVLNSVFLPVAFLGGFSGMLYKQFAVTIAISVFLSGIVALTLTPTLCAIFLKNVKRGKEKKKFKFFQIFDSGFDKLKGFYLHTVNFLIDRSKLAYIIFTVLVVITAGLYKIIPTSLMPLEDMGYYYTTVLLPGASSLDRTSRQSEQLAKFLHSFPATYQTLALIGVDILDNGTNKTNASFVVTTLNPWDKRKNKKDQINALISKTNQFGYMQKGARFVAFNSPPIRGLSQSGGVTFYLQTSTDVSVKQIYQDSLKLTKELSKYPAVGMALQFYDLSVPQLYIDLDRDKAKLYGIQISDVFTALQATFGTYYVNYFQKWNDLWWVILQSDYKYRSTPELLKTVYVRSSVSQNGVNNQLIPVGSLANVSFKNGPEVVTRFNDYLASQIIVNPKPGYTTGDVMDAVSDAVPKFLGQTYNIKWFGPAYQQASSGSSSSLAFVFGIIMVFLILAALYELWGLPLAVLMAIPFALFGAAIMLLISGRPNDIFFQVSLLTLIGLSTKNAILIVEFALDGYRNQGMSARDAAIEGARLRFRPIIMTSLAFILGAMPLVLADGAGANSQHSVGTGIVGGMLGSTLFAILFVPLFFTTFMKFSKRGGTKK
ncbi:MAG: efflux RND transporter permease subunit [Proteobacteria bacterium]|jgi:hydrophobe/amphiphile efflux-1 (HAE1) family protein|nr:efflux RND transporter permease subunit [Pseudomonadota bacterium]